MALGALTLLKPFGGAATALVDLVDAPDLRMTTRVRPEPKRVAPSANRENYDIFKRYLESRRDEIAVDDLELAAFVCATSIEALTHTAVLHHKVVATMRWKRSSIRQRVSWSDI